MNRSPMCRPSCNSMAFGCVSRRQSETIKLDKRQRKRQKRKGKKVVLLVALGLWTDGSGKREIWIGRSPMGKAKRHGSRLCIACGNGAAPGEGAAGGDPRWLWRVRRGHCLGLWKHGDRATLHLSQTAQCRRQVPQGTQRGGRNKEERKKLMSKPVPSIKRRVPQKRETRLATFAHTWRARTPKTVVRFSAILSRPLPTTV